MMFMSQTCPETMISTVLFQNCIKNEYCHNKHRNNVSVYKIRLSYLYLFERAKLSNELEDFDKRFCVNVIVLTLAESTSSANACTLLVLLVMG